MSVLIGMSGDIKGESFELSSDRIVIGRAHDCAIVINNPTVSTHHCELLPTEEGGYQLNDLGSTNGTRVNTHEAHATPLQSKDIVQVGSVELLYDGVSAKTVKTHAYAEAQVEEISEPVAAPSTFGNISPFKQKSRENRSLWLGLITVIGLLALAVAIFVLLKLIGVIGQ